uniref:Phycobilisome protein n=1 Tax=Cyanothece sp. (strain PCC 7425 / ATCC 29141) TaxID=395961 RepID=B8HV19_CYAP4
MLKQLQRLSLETDGRYATDAELKFLKDYLQTVDQRITTYEKVREQEEQIIAQTEAEVLGTNPNLFRKGNQDYSGICQRDRKHVLRISAAAMLMDDLDSLRDGFLCWYRTIIKAFKDQRAAQATYNALPEVLAQHLSPEEVALLRPALELDKSILTE